MPVGITPSGALGKASRRKLPVFSGTPPTYPVTVGAWVGWFVCPCHSSQRNRHGCCGHHGDQHLLEHSRHPSVSHLCCRCLQQPLNAIAAWPPRALFPMIRSTAPACKFLAAAITLLPACSPAQNGARSTPNSSLTRPWPMSPLGRRLPRWALRRSRWSNRGHHFGRRSLCVPVTGSPPTPAPVHQGGWVCLLLFCHCVQRPLGVCVGTVADRHHDSG